MSVAPYPPGPATPLPPSPDPRPPSDPTLNGSGPVRPSGRTPVVDSDDGADDTDAGAAPPKPTRPHQDAPTPAVSIAQPPPTVPPPVPSALPFATVVPVSSTAAAAEAIGHVAADHPPIVSVGVLGPRQVTGPGTSKLRPRAVGLVAGGRGRSAALERRAVTAGRQEVDPCRALSAITKVFASGMSSGIDSLSAELGRPRLAHVGWWEGDPVELSIVGTSAAKVGSPFRSSW
jgi:hypothetical protein